MGSLWSFAKFVKFGEGRGGRDGQTMLEKSGERMREREFAVEKILLKEEKRKIGRRGVKREREKTRWRNFQILELDGIKK